MKINKVIYIIPLILTSCAVTNEGKVDFRKTNSLETEKGACSICCVTPNNNDNDAKIAYKACQEKCEKSSDLEKLNAKNYPLKGEDPGFKTGDTVSLHLRTAYIHNFAENDVTPYITNAFTRSWREPIGEIAIVANAFEEDNGKELSFEDQENGRLVFYSDDVRRGQLLNFNNMPVYGPMPYKGAPFAFRISIFELDVTSERMKAMLDTVAKAGGMAYPPASQVLNLLNGIGKTLLNGAQNDTEFRYTMVLDPQGGAKELNHFKLEAGNYALVRVEDRNQYVPWDDIALNENEGEIYWMAGDKAGMKYTDNSYVVVEINKNVSTVQVELANNNYKDLVAALEKKDQQAADSLKSTSDEILNISLQRSRILNFSHAKDLLRELKDDQVSNVEKRFSAIELLTLIANSVDKGGQPKAITFDNNHIASEEKTLSGQQIQYLLRNVRSAVSATEIEKVELLNTVAIYEAFTKNEKGNKDKILNILAPIK